MEEIITEILNRINAAKIESFTSKTRNSGNYRIGLTKAIEIIYDIKLERREGKEPATEASGLSKHAVNQRSELLLCYENWREQQLSLSDFSNEIVDAFLQSNGG